MSSSSLTWRRVLFGCVLVVLGCSSSDPPMPPGVLPCPDTSTRKGTPPPAGDEVWCETEDGTRHGPATAWNAAGEMVRRAEYRNGALASVEYELPASGDLPPALFVCPDGETVVASEDGEHDVRWCDHQGTRGRTLRWKAGRVVAIEVPPRPNDPAQNRFVGYSNE